MEDRHEDERQDFFGHLFSEPKYDVPKPINNQSSSTGFSAKLDGRHAYKSLKGIGRNVEEKDFHTLELQKSFPSDEPSLEAVNDVLQLQSTVLACLGLSQGLQNTDGTEQSVPSLLANLKNYEVWTIRKAAIQSLEKLLGKVDKEEKRRIAIRLRIHALADPDWPVRVIAVRALARFEFLEATGSLGVVLRQDNNEAVRTAAVQALGELGEQTPITLLHNALKDEHWSVRAAAVQALGKIKHPFSVNYIVAALDDKDMTVRIEALRALASIQGAHAKPRLEMIAWRDRNELVRQEAKDELEQFHHGPSSSLHNILSQIAETGEKPSNDNVICNDDKEKEDEKVSMDVVKQGERQDNLPLLSMCQKQPCPNQDKGAERNYWRQYLSQQNQHGQAVLPIIPPQRRKEQSTKKSPRPSSSWMEPLVSVWLLIFAVITITAVLIIHQYSQSMAAGTDSSQWCGYEYDSHSIGASANSLQRCAHEYSPRPVIVHPNQIFFLKISFLNNGSSTWSDAAGYNVKYTLFQGQDQKLFDQVITLASTESREKHITGQGGVCIFDTQLKAPTSPGIYTMQWTIQHHNIPFGIRSDQIKIDVQRP